MEYSVCVMGRGEEDALNRWRILGEGDVLDE